MANIITQSEYEKRFGVKPFVASPTEDVVDTKPTPVILTQSEWRKMNNPQKPMGDYLQMGTNLNASVGRAGRGIIDTVKNPDLNTADKFVVGGNVVENHPGLVTARTSIGGMRVVDLPAGELLPRIC